MVQDFSFGVRGLWVWGVGFTAEWRTSPRYSQAISNSFPDSHFNSR